VGAGRQERVLALRHVTARGLRRRRVRRLEIRLDQVDPRFPRWRMVGPHVTDVVEAGVIAIDAGAAVETVADEMAPHPTLSAPGPGQS
jgi:pyridine nucleotide-disulfide oxidoreductase